MPAILRIKGALLSLTQELKVEDDRGDVLYKSHSNPISVSDKTHVEDAEGNEIALFHVNTLSLHYVYTIEMTKGPTFKLSSELLHLNRVIDVPELDWKLTGDFFDFDFTIEDASGRAIAKAQHLVMTLHDSYEVEVYDEAHVDEIVCIFIVLKHMIDHQRESAIEDNDAKQ